MKSFIPPQPLQIHIRDFFSESISSRDAIAMLFNREFLPNQEVVLDFTNVEFITRSAAHQLLKEIQRIEEFFMCKVNLCCCSTEVQKMIDIVRSNRITELSPSSEVKQVYFKTSAALNEFLLRF